MVTRKKHTVSEEEKRIIAYKKLRAKVHQALRRIARSLRNRGFEACYVIDKQSNDEYVLLPLSSILKVCKNAIKPELRPFVGITYVELEREVKEVKHGIEVTKKVREPNIVIYLDLDKLKELADKGVAVT